MHNERVVIDALLQMLTAYISQQRTHLGPVGNFFLQQGRVDDSD